MSRLAGSKILSEDFALPDVVVAQGNGTNTVTAVAYAVLPTTTCTANITNPHSTANMITRCDWGAWLNSTSNTIECCPAVSGSVTIAAGVVAGGAAGLGLIAEVTGSTTQALRTGTAIYTLPPGTATFSMQAKRGAASGTQKVDYPLIRLIPLWFDV